MLSGVCAKLLAQTAEKQIPTKQKITEEAKSRTNGGVISCEPRRSCAKAGEPVTLELRTRTASQSSALQESFANFVSFCLMESGAGGGVNFIGVKAAQNRSRSAHLVFAYSRLRLYLVA